LESGFGRSIVLVLIGLKQTESVSRILRRLGFLQRASEFSPQAESFAKWQAQTARREFGGRIFCFNRRSLDNQTGNGLPAGS
jgi:hypothetical protein